MLLTLYNNSVYIVIIFFSFGKYKVLLPCLIDTVEMTTQLSYANIGQLKGSWDVKLA
jgi:hypothetical protein